MVSKGLPDVSRAFRADQKAFQWALRPDLEPIDLEEKFWMSENLLKALEQLAEDRKQLPKETEKGYRMLSE